jgi:hypothetical protein
MEKHYTFHPTGYVPLRMLLGDLVHTIASNSWEISKTSAPDEFYYLMVEMITKEVNKRIRLDASNV